MSTRATIKFDDGFGDVYYVYRHCDGFPEEVQKEIQMVIDKKRNAWFGSEIGQLVAWFIILCNNPASRLADYELTTCWHGDESYKYSVKWSEERSQWEHWVD